MRTECQCGEEAGFSLLEVLVALMVLAVSYTALMQTISSAVLQAKNGAQLSEAAELADRIQAGYQAGRAGPNEGVDEASGLVWKIRFSPLGAGEIAEPSVPSILTIQIQIPGNATSLFEARTIALTGKR